MSVSEKLAPQGPITLILSTLTALCLGVSAYIHFDLASNYGPIRTSTLSQEDLFNIQGVVVIVLALGVLFAGTLLKGRACAVIFALAGLTMAASLAAVLVTRYYDTGKVLFVPDMYEPVWFAEKSWSAVAEGFGVIVAFAGAAASWLAAGHIARTEQPRVVATTA
jgi:hypothetical protein